MTRKYDSFLKFLGFIGDLDRSIKLSVSVIFWFLTEKYA